MITIRHLPILIVLAALQVLEWAGLASIYWYHYLTYVALWHVSHQWVPLNPVDIRLQRDQVTGKLYIHLESGPNPKPITLSIGTLQPNTGHVTLETKHLATGQIIEFKAISVRGQGIYLAYECNGNACSAIIVTGGQEHSPYIFDVDELRECNLWPFDPFEDGTDQGEDKKPHLWVIVDNTKNDDQDPSND